MANKKYDAKSNGDNKVIDYSKPIKLSKMTIDFMMGYIDEKDPGYKDQFKEYALNRVKEDKKSLDIKKIRSAFINKYPNTELKRTKTKKTSLEKLKEW